MRIYKEKTDDNSYKREVCASDNMATYILTSANAHDLYDAYIERYNRVPSSKWFNRHFSFERIK